MTLRDVPLPALKAVEAALEESCKPVVVQSASNLADEKARLQMMFDAGRHAVLEDVRRTIAQLTKETARG